MSRLIALRSQNVKRLDAVEITLGEDSMFVVGGKNGQGKSSTLDSIAMVLGGKELCPDVPIKRGQTEAEVEATIRCDDGVTLIVTRKFRAKDGGGYSSSLEVKEKTTRGLAKLNGAQGILDAMCSRFTFDPLAFTRMSDKEQVKLVQELVGLNTDELDAEIDQKFRERTEVNRRLKELDTRAAAAPRHEDAPESEVSVANLSNQLREAQTANGRVDALRRAMDDAKREVDRSAARVVELRNSLAEAEREYQRRHEAYMAAESEASGSEKVDTTGIIQQMQDAEAINRKVRENSAAKGIDAQADDTRKQSEALTAGIEALRQRKLELIANAKWPVEGMGFGDGCVTFNGLPISQASQAEAIKIGCRLGFSLCKDLPVLLIRDGSLLDDDSLREAEQIANECGGQIVMERVTSDADQCSVLIVDGKVDSGARARTSEMQVA